MRSLCIAVFLLLTAQFAAGQVPIPQVPQPVPAFSFEDKDWQVAPTSSAKRPPYHSPTPLAIPGARIIRTLELKALLTENDKVIVVDVLDSKSRNTIPGAYWLSGAGDGQFFAAEKARFENALENLTAGEKDRPIVFLCLSSECWLSYNASLYAVEAGYKDVLWYRGGTNAWSGASLDLKRPKQVRW